MMVCTILCTTILGLSATGFAKGKPGAAPCASVNLRTAAEGFECATTQGARFKLMHRSARGFEFWRDQRTGLVWSDRLTERVSRAEAPALCGKTIDGENAFAKIHANELPTLDDFAGAEKSGFREVLPHMKDDFYWIKSSVPGAANVGHVFNGNAGKPFVITYRAINFEHVRCVKR